MKGFFMYFVFSKHLDKSLLERNRSQWLDLKDSEGLKAGHNCAPPQKSSFRLYVHVRTTYTFWSDPGYLCLVRRDGGCLGRRGWDIFCGYFSGFRLFFLLLKRIFSSNKLHSRNLHRQAKTRTLVYGLWTLFVQSFSACPVTQARRNSKISSLRSVRS